MRVFIIETTQGIVSRHLESTLSAMVWDKIAKQLRLVNADGEVNCNLEIISKIVIEPGNFGQWDNEMGFIGRLEYEGDAVIDGIWSMLYPDIEIKQ
jgi:hypothetical protein